LVPLNFISISYLHIENVLFPLIEMYNIGTP
jgi:hypothetical protein